MMCDIIAQIAFKWQPKKTKGTFSFFIRAHLYIQETRMDKSITNRQNNGMTNRPTIWMHTFS